MKIPLQNTKLVIMTTILCLTASMSNIAFAQYEPQFTQYLNNEMFINPAYAGTRGFPSIGLLYRDQWVGIEGAPRTATFSINGPVYNDKMGLGLCVLNDRIGVTNQTSAFFNYAYHVPASEKGTLSFGLQGGIVNVRERLEDVVTIDPNDPEFANGINKTMPNFGFGMYYHTRMFYLGFSIPRFLENKIDPYAMKIVSNQVRMQNWHYYLFSSYVMPAGQNFKIKPSAMVKVTDGAPLEGDISLNVLFKEIFWVGASYRTGDAIALLTQFQLTKQLRFGYSYDYTLTKLSAYGNGSHEFTIGYDFTFNKSKIITPRFF
jgi:type IX secretion system PorP/SprF family membrane protein